MNAYQLFVIKWNLGDLSAWLVAVGTVGTLAAALWQIGNERKARREDQRQALDAARREQAQRVSAWYAGEVDGHTKSRIAVLNASEEPVYQAVVTLVFIQGAAPQRGEDYANLAAPLGIRYRSMLGVIPPGRWTTDVSSGWHGMMVRPGAEVAFTDRAGVYWVRRADGTVEELPEEPIDHFQINRPVDWAAPDLGR